MEGTVSGPNDWNAGIVAQFRANEGRVGGQFEGSTLLLLHTVGRRSGVERINPLAYFADGDRYLIVASKGGHPSNPDWYFNLVDNPRVTIEVGTETFEADAVEVAGEDREIVWKRIVATAPGFGEYQKRTDRILPVIALTRAA
jgi:deazaflavin-dependent oxidoreductase (nitroreductase family)